MGMLWSGLQTFNVLGSSLLCLWEFLWEILWKSPISMGISIGTSMRISMGMLWSGLRALVGSSILNPNVRGPQAKLPINHWSNQIPILKRKGLLNLHLRSSTKEVFRLHCREILVNIFQKLCLEWKGGGREACSGAEGSESFFSRKFSESDWHLSISSPPLSCRSRWGEEEQKDKERGWERARVCVGKCEGWEEFGGKCEEGKCPFCRFLGNPPHHQPPHQFSLNMSVSLCVSHIYHHPSVAAMKRSCNNLGKTEKSISPPPSKVIIRGKQFSPPGWGVGGSSHGGRQGGCPRLHCQGNPQPHPHHIVLLRRWK